MGMGASTGAGTGTGMKVDRVVEEREGLEAYKVVIAVGRKIQEGG